MPYLRPSRVLTHTEVAVEGVSTTVLPSAPSRVYVLLVNDSDTDMYLRIGSAAGVNKGVRINAEGGAYEMSIPSGNISDLEINAVHTGEGRKNLLVLEGHNR